MMFLRSNQLGGGTAKHCKTLAGKPPTANEKEERYEFDYVKERDTEGAAGAFQV